MLSELSHNICPWKHLHYSLESTKHRLGQQQTIWMNNMFVFIVWLALCKGACVIFVCSNKLEIQQDCTWLDHQIQLQGKHLEGSASLVRQEQISVFTSCLYPVWKRASWWFNHKYALNQNNAFLSVKLLSVLACRSSIWGESEPWMSWIFCCSFKRISLSLQPIRYKGGWCATIYCGQDGN